MTAAVIFGYGSLRKGSMIRIIIGWYEDKWWETKLNENHITCTTREMGEAVEGYLATDHMKLNEDDATSKHKTVSG